MQNYTPTPAPLGATISLPQDAIDNVIVSTVRTAIEPMADAIAWRQAARVCFAYIQQSGSPVADNAHMPLALSSSYPSGTWLISSNEIQVPAPGVYKVSLKCAATTAANTGVPQSANFRLMAGASYDFAWATGERWSSTITDSFLTVGWGTVVIGTPASEKIWVKNTCGAAANVVSGGGSGDAVLNPLVIEYMGAAT